MQRMTYQQKDEYNEVCKCLVPTEIVKGVMVFCSKCGGMIVD